MVKAKKIKSFSSEFYANMNWFDVAEQPKKIQDLPNEFVEAKKLWKLNKTLNQQSINNLLGPYLKARFVLDNLTGIHYSLQNMVQKLMHLKFE